MKSLLRVFAALFCSAFLAAQTPTPQAPPTPSQQPPSSTQRSDQQKKDQTGDIGIQVESGDAKNSAGQQAKPEKQMSKEEAEQLFASVDEILKFVSADTGYAIKGPIKRELSSRDAVQKFLEDRMKDDEDAKRLIRSEVVLKKFGLIPRDFDLGKFLVQLLREQVAGFYDYKTKTVYLLDWLDPDVQKPVLAHELTHALQDQNFDLKTWQDIKGKPNTRAEYEEDEASTARSAVSEGQGMLTLIDWYLKPRTLLEVPQAVDIIKQSMGTTQNSPVLASAPVLLRDSLMYPYREGFDFEIKLLFSGGRDTAFSDAFKHPPSTTHEVMEPQTYLAHEAAPQLSLPELNAELKGKYDRYDVGSIGQFDVRLMATQYADATQAKALAPSWRGGAYYAALRRHAPEKPSPADVAIAYLSQWENDRSARQFVGIYQAYLSRRYKTVSAVASPQPCVGCISVTEFSTDEGPVRIEMLSDSRVLVLEGFEAELQPKLHAALASEHASVEGNQIASVPSLALRIGSVAMVRDAIAANMRARVAAALSPVH